MELTAQDPKTSPMHRPLAYTNDENNIASKRQLLRMQTNSNGADSNLLRALQPDAGELDEIAWTAMMHATFPTEDHYGASFHKGVLQRLKYLILSSTLGTLVRRWITNAHVPYHIPGITDTPDYPILEHLEPINSIYTEIAFFMPRTEWQERSAKRFGSMEKPARSVPAQQQEQARPRTSSTDTNLNDLIAMTWSPNGLDDQVHPEPIPNGCQHTSNRI